ncbi:MAG: hypothetical protein IPL78_07040 [Chloroflexi bacterium]|nr:hypothetical protein [Chloroflexota bacterium]
MHILFLSRWYPYPTDNGAKIRVFNLLKHLAERHTVDLIAFADRPVGTTEREAMQVFCQRVADVPYQPFQPTRAKGDHGFFGLAAAFRHRHLPSSATKSGASMGARKPVRLPHPFSD